MKNSIFTPINKAHKGLNDLGLSIFEKSLSLAAQVASLDDAWTKDTHKALGYATKKDLLNDRNYLAFGYVQWTTYVFCGNVKSDDLTAYRIACDEAEEKTGTVTRSLEGLKAWIKRGGSAINPIAVDEKDLDKDPDPTKEAQIMGFNCQAVEGDQKANVVFRIDQTGKVVTTNTLAEITEALELALALVTAEMS